MAINIQQLIQRLRESGVKEEDIQRITATYVAASDTGGAAQLDPQDLQARTDEIMKLLEDNRGIIDGVIDVEEERERLEEEETRLLREMIEDEIASGNMQRDRVLAAQRRYKLLQKRAKLRRIEKEGYEKGKVMADRLLAATMGINTEFAFLGKKGGLQGLLKGFVKKMMSALNPISLTINAITKMFDSIMDFDRLNADLFRKTGLQDSLFDVRKAESELQGMKTQLTKDFFAAQQSMVSNITDVTTLTGTQTKELAKVMTALQATGVRMDDTAQSFVELTKSLGHTPEQATNLLTNFYATAHELGRPPAQFTRDFARAQPILARFGQDSVNIFKRTATAAMLTNMDVQKVIQLNEGMDTFEGAAKAAQAFNVAFGQPFISAHALLQAQTPGEKMQLIAKAFERLPEQAKRNMSPRMIRGLGKDIGVDPNELARILKMPRDKFSEKATKVEDASNTMKQLKDTVFRNQTVQDMILAQIERIINNLIRATGADGVLGIAKNLATFMAEMLDTFDMFGLFGRKKDTKMKKPKTAKEQKAGRQTTKKYAAGKRTVPNIGKDGKPDGTYTIPKAKDLFGQEIDDSIGMEIRGDSRNFLDAIGNFFSGDEGGFSRGQFDDFVSEYEKLHEYLHGPMRTARMALDARFKSDPNFSGMSFPQAFHHAFKEKHPLFKSREYRNFQKAKSGLLKVGGGFFKAHQIQDLRDYAYRNMYGDPGRTSGFGLNTGFFRVDPGQASKFRTARARGELNNANRGSKQDFETLAETIFFDVFLKSQSDGVNPKATAQQFLQRMTEAVPEKQEDAYVQPVFNAKDKFYAAKDGGAIANALDEVLSAVNKLIEQKQDVNLDINSRKLVEAVDDGLKRLQRA